MRRAHAIGAQEYANRGLTAVVIPVSVNNIDKPKIDKNTPNNVINPTGFISGSLLDDGANMIGNMNALDDINANIVEAMPPKGNSLNTPHVNAHAVDETAFEGNPLTKVTLSKRLYAELFSQGRLGAIFGSHVKYWDIQNPSQELNEKTTREYRAKLEQNKLEEQRREAARKAAIKAYKEAVGVAKAKAQKHIAQAEKDGSLPLLGIALNSAKHPMKVSKGIRFLNVPKFRSRGIRYITKAVVAIAGKEGLLNGKELSKVNIIQIIYKSGQKVLERRKYLQHHYHITKNAGSGTYTVMFEYEGHRPTSIDMTFTVVE